MPRVVYKLKNGKTKRVSKIRHYFTKYYALLITLIAIAQLTYILYNG